MRLTRRSTGLLVLVLSAAISCSDGGQATVAAEPQTLPAGTEVKGILMKTLISGATDEGEEVPLIVSEDVKGTDGKVLIRKGAPIKAKVAWSRGEGSLDGMIGRPSRLHIRFLEATAADGAVVPLASNKDLKEDATYELNRENTGKAEPPEKVKAALTDPQNAQALQTLASLLEDGKITEDENTPEKREQVARLLTALDLSSSSEMAKANQLTNLGQLFKDAGEGKNLLSLATGNPSMAINAVVEVAKMASSIPNRLGRALQGRSIRAHVGTPVVAYVAKDTQVLPE